MKSHKTSVPIFQNYKVLDGMKNVFCSDLISYDSKSPSFHKIVRDYDSERPITVKVSFRNRGFHFAIYNYIKYEYLKKSIEKSNNDYNILLTFISPKLWNDPCESVFYKPVVKIGNDSYNVLCLCTTLEPTESEESAWNRNGRSDDLDEKTVRIAYDFQSFCNLLQKMAEKDGNVQFYLSMVDYSESRAYFNPNNKRNYSCLEEYICDLSKKRKAFVYENEMRVFAVMKTCGDGPSKDNTKTFEAELRKGEVEGLFKNVTLPPYPPISKDNPKSFYYSKIQDLDNFDLRIRLNDLYGLFNIQINQSRLYELKGNNRFAEKLVRKYQSQGKYKTCSDDELKNCI